MKPFPPRRQKQRRPQWRPKLLWKAPPIGRILPNIVTLSALCTGLTAIRFAFLTQWEQAVASVLIAGILDGVDGRLARFLKTNSDFGAELDSLADFINFGVAPGLLVYYFSLHRLGNIGWGICLFFSACMALRLARFNIQRNQLSAPYFIGVPAPAGALIILFPIIASFVFKAQISCWFFSLFTLFGALMVASRYPTLALKNVTIPQKHMGLFFMGILALVTGLLSAPWETLFMIALSYILSLPFSGYYFYKRS